MKFYVGSVIGVKTYIRNLHLQGFKSFGRKTDLEFCHGLNAVIGPNGSGKSNILDTLCFILGRMSSKDLRAENFSDLIFKRKSQSAGEAETAIHLDNSGGVFPVDSKSVEIRRRIKKDGSTQYKINGRNATRQEVLELLSLVRVHPEGHNIILQGDIAHFVDMKPLERRNLIEEIAGIGAYEERKNKALSELGKVEDRLKEANIILSQKEEYMKNLEDEKLGAEKYKSMQSELKAVQAAEIQMRLDLVNGRKNKVLSEIEKRDNTINQSKLDLEISKKKIETLRDGITKLEKQIEKKGGEESLELQKSIEVLRISAEKSRTLIAASHNEIQRVDSRRSDLQKNLTGIEKKIGETQKEVDSLKKQRSTFSKESGAEGDNALAELNEQIGKFDSEISELNSERDSLTTKNHELNTEIKLIEQKIDGLEKQFRVLSSDTTLGDLQASKTKYKKLVEEINALANRDSKLALDLGNLRKELISKEEELAKSRVHHGAAQELMQRDRAIKEIFSLKKKLSGILGTIAELGKVDKEYEEALKVAAGNRMKHIVVSDVDTAIKALQALKAARAGIATFLPLNKIQAPPESTDREILKKAGVLGLASELITCESKYKPVFRYVFRNTLVVKDITIAKSLGVGKYRLVTLEGDLFEPTGAITGGFRDKGVGIGFERTDLSGAIVKVESDLSLIQKNVSQLESERGKIEVQIANLRREKAELEGRAEVVKALSKQTEPDALEKEINSLKDSQKELDEQFAASEKELKKLQAELEDKTTERDALRGQLTNLTSGRGKTALEEAQTKKAEVESQLAAATATLENALQPEQENISRVLKELDKEKKTFEKQIESEDGSLKKFEKQIDDKEKEQEHFHGKLKELISDKNGASVHLRDEESGLNKVQFEIAKSENERNSLNIEKAQHEAEFTVLKQELEPFADIKIAEGVKNIDEAKRRIKSLNEKLTSLGNVNMRALEVFEAVQEEYKNLAGRHGKLATEKSDILNMIDEIEKKKKDAFMGAYDGVSGHFTGLHKKVAAKNFAVLELENPDKPFEGGVTVRIVDEKGRKTSLASLSGGEKTLVALAFIFAIQEHDPAPFYLLDEIDAALDKVNSEKVAKLLKEYSQKAQVVVITHNDAVISEADQIYGVSMNAEKMSNVVSVKI